MTITKALFILAGTVVMIGSVLALTIDPMWNFLTLFVGFNMFQSAFTGICPAAYIFKKLGLNE